MKNTHIRCCAALVAAVAMLPLPAHAQAPAAPLTRVVEQYLSARKATMEEKATEADLDRLLAFYADDVVYEHPRVKMKVEGKATMRGGMTRFLGVTKEPGVRLVRQIAGVNVVVAEYTLTFKAKQGDAWQDVSRTQVTVFEFADGAIKRVIDYW